MIKVNIVDSVPADSLVSSAKTNDGQTSVGPNLMDESPALAGIPRSEVKKKVKGKLSNHLQMVELDPQKARPDWQNVASAPINGIWAWHVLCLFDSQFWSI